MTIADSSMNGKTCLVTGATRGLGWATALELARMGATVMLAGRSRERLERAAEEIRAAAEAGCAGRERVMVFQGDLAALEDVRRLAAEVGDRFGALDVLVNNVGAAVLDYQESPDGYEMTWALNYLGHFLLTNLLLEPLKQAAALRGDARIVEVTSSVYRLSDPALRQMQQREGYNGVKAYAQSKRAMLLYTRELARRMQGSGVVINAVSPGFVRTNIAAQNGSFWRAVMALGNLFSTPLEEGVKPILRLAADPALCGFSGGYYQKFREGRPDPSLDDPEVTRRVWELSLHQTGLC